MKSNSKELETENITNTMRLDNLNKTTSNNHDGKIYTEDNKHVSVVQHEKRAQDTNIANIKIGTIIEDGKSPTQKGNSSIKIMNMVQDMQKEVLEETIQIESNNDAMGKMEWTSRFRQRKQHTLETICYGNRSSEIE
ncbi:499_t:CDS:2 [Gigaspora rosea]|nr:499_t:CDS:2 [Gigaspora rosea]